ncbi:MAG TPA: DUF115 domain-containing protein [bacterium]|nr:DUF115 domain-containing protein [bacterium]HPN32456.1 DUF115 domain-containing protein [bacterium]
MHNFEITDSKTGMPVFKPLITPKQRIIIHSLYDPQREADRVIGQYDFSGKEIIFLFGLGLGYHLKSLIAAAGGKPKIIVVERFDKIFDFFKINKSRLNINDANVDYLVNPDKSQIIFSASKFITFRNFYKIKYITIPSLIKLDEQYYKSAILDAYDFIKFTIANLSTASNFGYEWNVNYLKNLKRLSESYDIKSLKKFCKNKPAVIASAGPSLSRNLDLLKEFQDYFYILCADTAYSALLKKNIYPDFIGAADSQYENFKLVKGLGSSKVGVICPPIVNHNILSEFDSSKKFFFASELPLDNYLKSKGINLTFIKSGGSVATILFSAAREIEFNPIIFIGQDLAFTGNISHSALTSKIEHKYSSLSKFHSIENAFYAENSNQILCDDIFDNNVITSQSLLNFKNWFELEFTDKKSKYINSTGAGILKNNIEIVPFEEAIKLFCKNKINKTDLPEFSYFPKKIISSIIMSIKNELCELLKSEEEKILLKLTKSELNDMISSMIQFDLLNFETGKLSQNELAKILKNIITKLLKDIDK